jgi:hypothetical protein
VFCALFKSTLDSERPAVEALLESQLDKKSIESVWARRCPHPHRVWAHPCHICAGTGLTPAHIRTGTGLTPATSAWNIPHPDWAPGMALGGCRRLEAGLETPHLTSWEAAVPHLSLPSPGHARHGNAESPNPGTCAPGLGSPLPHPRRDWTHPRSRLHRNCAHCFNAWAGSALVHAHAHGRKTPRYCSSRTLRRRLGFCRAVCCMRMRTNGHVSAPEGSLEMGLRRSSATTAKVRKHAACKAHRAQRPTSEARLILRRCGARNMLRRIRGGSAPQGNAAEFNGLSLSRALGIPVRVRGSPRVP